MDEWIKEICERQREREGERETERERKRGSLYILLLKLEPLSAFE